MWILYIYKIRVDSLVTVLSIYIYMFIYVKTKSNADGVL